MRRGADTNLLTDTLEVLKTNGKTPDDVLWVGDGKYSCDWATFAAAAEHVDFDSGFGGNEIANGLVVVGTDWWLERGEYDGSEWWEFKRKPEQPQSGLVVIMER